MSLPIKRVGNIADQGKGFRMGTQVIFLGAPGSGKGTQASRLVEGLSYSHVSTGDLLRNEVKKESELGKKVQQVMAAGDLVSDELVLELLKVNCDLSTGNYIFDGFPRNIDQAKSLEEAVLKGTDSKAIYFKIDLDVLKERLVNRRSCGKCGAIFNLKYNPPKASGVCDSCGNSELTHRKDDSDEAVGNRLSVFKSTIDPVLEYYKERGVLREIDASSNPSNVFEELKKAIEL